MITTIHLWRRTSVTVSAGTRVVALFLTHGKHQLNIAKATTSTMAWTRIRHCKEFELPAASASLPSSSKRSTFPLKTKSPASFERLLETQRLCMLYMLQLALCRILSNVGQCSGRLSSLLDTTIMHSHGMARRSKWCRKHGRLLFLRWCVDDCWSYWRGKQELEK